MGNYKYYNYEDTGKDLTNKPANIHLVIELDSDEIYFVKITTQVELYHFNVTTGVETQIDIDPSNSSGDQKSRDHKIQSLWHDRTNSTIWGVDCDNDGTANDFDIWKLDYTSSKTSPTVTEIGTSSGADANTVYVYDIFIIGSDTYVINREERNTVKVMVVWDVDTAPFKEKDINIWTALIDISFTVIIGTNAYFIGDTTGGVGMLTYNSSTATLTLLDDEPGYDFSTNKNLLSLAYDGSDIIYFNVEKTADGKNYLGQYSISGDLITILSEFNVTLMLDRNTDSSADPPNNLEKGFHISEDKIYQIPLIYNGRLNLISVFDFTDTIITITDHFVIDNSGNVYEFVDLLNSFFEGIIYHSRNDYPYFKMKYNSDNITIVTQMFLQIIGPYTRNGSTIQNQVVFEGVATQPSKGRIQYVEIVNQGSEMDQFKPDGSKAGRTDEIIVDINNDGAPHGPEYIQDGTLSAGGAMGTLEFNNTKTYRKVVNDFAEHDGFLFYLKPQGQLDYNDGSVDSGADIRYDGSGNLDVIIQLKSWDVAKHNQIIVNGAINSVTGRPYSGQWDDEDDQLTNGINSITIEDASLNSDALCQSKADTVGAGETERIRARFGFKKNIYGFIQPGQTITFKYDIINYITISEAQYILDKIIMDIRTEMGYAEISSGL